MSALQGVWQQACSLLGWLGQHEFSCAVVAAPACLVLVPFTPTTRIFTCAAHNLPLICKQTLQRLQPSLPISSNQLKAIPSPLPQTRLLPAAPGRAAAARLRAALRGAPFLPAAAGAAGAAGPAGGACRPQLWAGYAAGGEGAPGGGQGVISASAKNLLAAVGRLLATCAWGLPAMPTAGFLCCHAACGCQASQRLPPPPLAALV